MQELMDKQLDSHDNQHEEEQEMESSSNNTENEKNVHRSLMIDEDVKEKYDLVIEELKQHQLFQKQKQLEKGEKTDSDEELAEDLEEKVENEPPRRTRARRNAMIKNFEPKDNQIKSIIQIRNMVLLAKQSGELDSVHTYVEKEGFMEKFSKDQYGTLKEYFNKGKKAVINKVKSVAKDKLVYNAGDTIAGFAESVSSTAGNLKEKNETLYNALKDKNVAVIKHHILALLGDSTLGKIVSQVAEWICNTFGGKSGQNITKGLAFIEEFVLHLGPFGRAIQTVKNGVSTAIKAYKLVKNLKGSTMYEIVHGAADVVESGFETAKSAFELVESIADAFKVLEGFASTIPIIGSAINIAMKGVKLIRKAYNSFQSIYLMVLGNKEKKKLMNNEFVEKYKKEASFLGRKYEDMDYDEVISRKNELEMKLKSEGLTKDEMRELRYLQKVRLYNHLGELNQKKLIRNVIGGSEDLVTIGAEIANLLGAATEGVGTAVGTALKAVVTVEKTGRKTWNVVKQLGRDYGSEKIFDKSKKTSAKMKEYYKSSYTILNEIALLPAYRDDVPEISNMYEEAKRMLKIANVNVHTIAKKKNLTEVRDYLVKTMKKRD